MDYNLWSVWKSMFLVIFVIISIEIQTFNIELIKYLLEIWIFKVVWDPNSCSGNDKLFLKRPSGTRTPLYLHEVPGKDLAD